MSKLKINEMSDAEFTETMNKITESLQRMVIEKVHAQFVDSDVMNIIYTQAIGFMSFALHNILMKNDISQENLMKEVIAALFKSMQSANIAGQVHIANEGELACRH